MSYIDLQFFIKQSLLYISPSGLHLPLSANQDNILGDEVSNQSVSEFLKQKKYEFIVVHIDSFCIDSFSPDCFEKGCNLIVLLGDTHHGISPITRVSEWIRASPTKRILNYSCPHHDELIQKLTDIECVYFPVIFAIKYWMKPSPIIHTRMPLHIGSTSKIHIRRRAVLRYICESGQSIECKTIFGTEMIKALNKAPVIINCSLNCDISHRVSEAIAAGTLIITEELTQFQKSLKYMSEFGIIQTYSFYDLRELVNVLEELQNQLARESGRRKLFERKIISHHLLRKMIKDYDLYKLAALYITLEDIELPDILCPVTTDLSKKFIQDNIFKYEEFMESHRIIGNPKANLSLSNSDETKSMQKLYGRICTK